MEETKANTIKQYQRQYFLKTREKRRNKVKCEKCERVVCSEYLLKHQNKLICSKQKTIKDKTV